MRTALLTVLILLVLPALTGADGAKSVTMSPHEGSYRYRALAGGYAPRMSESVKFEEGEVTVDFELTPLGGSK